MTGLAGVGTRLYDSPARAELYGYSRNNVAYCRPSSSASFRAQLTGERDRPLCSNETSDLRQNWTLCDHRTSLLCMHMASRTRRIFAAVPSTGPCLISDEGMATGSGTNIRRPQLLGACLGLRTSLYHDVIIWGHVFVFHFRDYKEMFNVPWTLKIVSFPKFVMRFN